MLKQKYRSQATAVATYDFEDIAEGTGVAHYYAYVSNVPTYHLTGNSAVYSSHIAIVAPNETYTFNLTKYNTPRYARGTAIVCLSRYSSGTEDITVTITLQKVDGNTAAVTNLAAAQGKAIATSGINVVNYTIPITSTLFKIGDNLRLVVTVSGITGDTFTFGADPMNRTSTAPTGTLTPSTLDVYLPFRIDV